MNQPVIVTGSRDWSERHQVDLALDNCKAHGMTVLVQGGCETGADLMAREWAERNGFPCITVHAWWSFFGDAAGPKRNEWMCRMFAPDAYVLAFVKGLARGTRNCCNNAVACGLKVFETFEEIPF